MGTSTSEHEPVGIAVVGAGLMGAQHARSAAHCPDARLVAVAAADAGQAAALAGEHGVPALGSLEEALALDEVEAVVLATPTDSHATLAEAAFAAGCHVLSEKPMARTLEGGIAMRRAAREAGRVLQVGHVIRYFPDYRGLHDAVTSGRVGTPAVATFGRRCQRPDWAPDAWHTALERSGGVALDMLVHDVDLVRWIFGEPTRVYARVHGSDRHDGLDYALATLEVPDGPICHLHGSWCEPEGFSQSAEVAGSGGMVSYDSRGREELRIASHDTADAVTALPPPPPGEHDPFQRQLRDFCRAIRTGSRPPADGDWALATLRIGLAMLESSEQGEPVELEPLEQWLAGLDAEVTA